MMCEEGPWLPQLLSRLGLWFTLWRKFCSFFFFFSSRRRHTKLTCDWSSDVCSSDLAGTSVGDAELARKLAQLPRVATLVPARDNPIPAVVDAWVALQALRAAVMQPGREKLAGSMLDQTDVEQIALEHVLVGSAIDGSPAGHSGGGLAANPNSSSGVTGPGSTDSYVYSGGDTR